VMEGISSEGFPQKNLIVAMTTDKGLCGGVNAILCRLTRDLLLKLDSEGKSADLYVMGDKGRGILSRQFTDKIKITATERIMPYTFDLASTLAQDAIGGEYDQIHIVYNEFTSAIAYVPSIKSIKPLVDPADEFLFDIDVEPENDTETLANFYEYTLATQIFHSLMDNAASEQSSRMSAMENASKNAQEQIEKLQLKYNRARQARITTELIEIISGAAALEK
jgi:F-type H+-transporting ATPase subunit gamma